MSHDNDNRPVAVTADGIRFLSVCSGIEAASVAWHPLGWKAVAFSEIEKFPSAVLAHHYPDVPNLGDFTKIDTATLGRVDVLAGGTPCQAFSVAGLRQSLADARGNLSLEFVRLAHELAANNGLRNVVWENVVGVLSTKDNAFGCFLAGLVGADSAIDPPARGKWPGAGMVSGPKGRAAWRVLDAQYFGVAQRRRRVIVVADFGNGADPAAVLFEHDGLRRHSPPSREAGKDVAGTVAGGAGGGGEWPAGVASTLNAAFGEKLGLENQHINSGAPLFVPQAIGVHGDIAHTLKAEGADASEGGAGRGTPNVLASGAFATSAVRRLTPLECERLQGFPETRENLYIQAWKQHSFDHHQSDANAGTPSRKSLKSVSNADASASMSNVQNAVSLSSASHPECGRLADVHALINFERNDLLLHSPRNSNWSVNIAEHLNSSLLSMPVGDFARLIAHIFTIQEKIMSAGKAASLANTSNSSRHLSGKPRNVPYGHESSVSASDAALFMAELDAFMKSITSKAGHEIGTLEQRLQTSLSFATSVISSCIPATISTESSFSLTIEGVRGYTAIPWRGKPADQCPDGPRYKALGNSWAVPKFVWLGKRMHRLLTTTNTPAKEAA